MGEGFRVCLGKDSGPLGKDSGQQGGRIPGKKTIT